jgi:hypothetical protein
MPARVCRYGAHRSGQSQAIGRERPDSLDDQIVDPAAPG